MFDLLTSFSAELLQRAKLAEVAAEWVQKMNSHVVQIFPAKARVGKQKIAFASAADFLEVIGEGEEFSIELYPQSSSLSVMSARISTSGGHLDCQLQASAKAFGPNPTNMFLSQAKVFEDLAQQHGKNIKVAAYCGSSIRNLSFDRVRPPRDFQIVGTTSLVDIIDSRSFEKSDEKAFAYALMSNRLPEKTSRTKIGQIVIICWQTDPMVTAATIADALTKRDLWLYKNAIGTVKQGWNEYGDVLSDPVGATAHKDITLYSPMLETGYQAVHSASSLEDQRLAVKKLATFLKEGRLSDGSNLVNAFMVADNRTQALKILEEANVLGICKAVYPENGHFWDPNPDGEWLEIK